MTIDLAEQWARQLAEPLMKVAILLEHLRGLEKLGLLVSDALRDIISVNYESAHHSDDQT